MTTKTFWGCNHPLSNEYRSLSEKLVPGFGRCDTVQGELLRAASRINYDWFNNGWGCNNWSGAVLYIKQHMHKLPVVLSHDDALLLNKSLDECHSQSHGEPMHIVGDYASALCTTVLELVLKLVMENPDPVKNEIDMFELSEDDYVEREEDDYDGYDGCDD